MFLSLPFRRASPAFAPVAAALAVSLLFASAAKPVAAVETAYIGLSGEESVFEFNIYRPSDGSAHTVTVGAEDFSASDREPTAKELEALRQAAMLWSEVFRGDAAAAARFDVVFFKDYPNAAAVVGTDSVTPAPGFAGSMADAIQRGDSGASPSIIYVGDLAFDFSTALDPLPSGSGVNFVSTIVHEISHAAGIYDSISVGAASSFDLHLFDAEGRQMQADSEVIVTTGDGNSVSFGGSGSPFIIDFGLGAGPSGVTFRGEHVAEVLQGSGMLGAPINGAEADENGAIFLELSHIEFEHGLLSHQYYRNYLFFLEAELAVLQDLGYDIDRRRFYGRSIYGDGGTIVNSQGFFERNDAGTAYLEGVPSDAPFGIGLHIYGKDNIVVQTADLLTAGDAAVGIRIDGKGNDVTLAKGAAIAADGRSGAGILVAYGKDHRIASQGRIQALGEGGIGVRFDFGGNMLGDDTEYRGSYIWGDRVSGAWYDINAADDLSGLPLNLNGPLVESFDLSGELAGRAAAVYISENAYVKHINILSGASIEGDIISEWDREDFRIQHENPASLVTTLSFGLAQDASGHALESADPDFEMRYDGRILSTNGGINLEAAGGSLEFNGLAEVGSVWVKAGAVLSGNALYKLYQESSSTLSVDAADSPAAGVFLNDGTLAPGSGNSLGCMEIQGRFEQSGSGRLAVDFDAAGRTDVLKVDGSAALAGSLALAPAAGYYSSEKLIDIALDDVVQASGGAAAEAGFQIEADGEALSSRSPTLKMTQAASYAESVSIRVERKAEDVYSSYAASAERARLAQVFDAHADEAEGAMQALVAGLDFSAADGSELDGAYASLLPTGYDRAMAASLSGFRETASAVLGSARQGRSAADGASAFAIPLGGYRHDSRAGARSRWAGMAFGAEQGVRMDAGSAAFGSYAAYAHRRDALAGGSSAEADSFYAGAYFSYQADAGLTLQGALQAGLEEADMTRTAHFGGYAGRASADWTAWGVGASASAGWRFAISDQLWAGPAVILDYARMHRPSVEESGDGMALAVSAQSADSLRSRAGLQGRWTSAPGEASAWSAGLAVFWNQELLKGLTRSEAAFRAAPDMAFGSEGAALSRTSGTAAADAALRWKGGRASIVIGTEFGGEASAVWGGLDIRLQF